MVLGVGLDLGRFTAIAVGRFSSRKSVVVVVVVIVLPTAVLITLVHRLSLLALVQGCLNVVLFTQVRSGFVRG